MTTRATRAVDRTPRPKAGEVVRTRETGNRPDAAAAPAARLPSTSEPDRRSQILDVARSLASESGVGGMTFDAIASRLAVTKQAVLYWFPSKRALLAALAFDAFAAEADVVCTALEREPRDPRRALRHALRALFDHYERDLTSFRGIYLAPQLAPERLQTLLPPEDRPQPVYAHTARMYGALETRVAALRPSVPDARTLAVGLHTGTLGFVLMASVMQSSGDSMKRPMQAYLEAWLDQTLGRAAIDRAPRGRRSAPRRT